MVNRYPVFDAHFHIIDPAFPIFENQGFLPPTFTCQDYLARMGDYQLMGGTVVSGSFQGYDQTYLVHALDRLGPGFVGVTQLPDSVPDQEIMRLNQAGVRAVRFNLKRGGSETVDKLHSLAERIHALASWHVEIYVDSVHLEELFPLLSSLPAASIDHLGLSQAGLPTLLRLAEKGIMIKATGFGRCDHDVLSVMQQLYSINPEGLMFGSDLPSTRAPRPYSDDDFERVIDAVGYQGLEDVLYNNAARFYRLADI